MTRHGEGRTILGFLSAALDRSATFVASVAKVPTIYEVMVSDVQHAMHDLELIERRMKGGDVVDLVPVGAH